jgi:hypothetical protein
MFAGLWFFFQDGKWTNSSWQDVCCFVGLTGCIADGEGGTCHDQGCLKSKAPGRGREGRSLMPQASVRQQSISQTGPRWHYPNPSEPRPAPTPTPVSPNRPTQRVEVGWRCGWRCGLPQDFLLLAEASSCTADSSHPRSPPRLFPHAS